MKIFNDGSVRRELDARANEFSNFEDFEDVENFEDFEDFDDDFEDFDDDCFDCYDEDSDYIGANDQFLDYGGNGISFAAHNQGFRTSSVTISLDATNTSTKFQLFGDLLTGVADASYVWINEDNNGSKYNFSGSPKTIKRLYGWLQQQPTILQGFQLVCSDPTVLSGIVERYEVSPFRDMATDPINLSVYRNEYQYQSSILTVPNLNQVIGNQNYWVFTLPANKALTVTINLYFGVSLNNSTALQNKMNLAQRNILRMGGTKVVNALTTGTTNGTQRSNLITSNALTASTTTAAGRRAATKATRQANRAARKATRQENRAARKAARQERRAARKRR